ncbi:MAG: DUF4846 domain-containing protein [Ignavibacteria bacterium]|nr:DUF4846 domain-containing protein [Ignavibacteria bacterium]
MKILVIIILISCNFLCACGQNDNYSGIVKDTTNSKQENKFINAQGSTVEKRFITPPDYERVNVIDNSYEKYLRQLPLKPHGSSVLFYNGKIKENKNIYDAVVDLKIGDKDLHQCADAIMRLRAEYLYGTSNYDKIHFKFTNGFRMDYSEWMKGKRIVVKRDKTYWKQMLSPSNTYNDFWNYMEIIFTYAGTYSLSNELIPVNIDNLKIGDIFIQGGFPGHAVIVVDMAINPKTNDKIFLLAQSYMPAQEIQILKNPNDENISPWYSVNFDKDLITPEWKFQKSDLTRFEE